MDEINRPELFEHYQVDRVSRWPIMGRLAAVSLVLHMIFIAVALYVPAVREALNIGAMMAGAGYVDRAYKKTEIGDRATIIDLAGEKFRYPDGYFYKGDPAVDPNAPQIIAMNNPVPPPVPVIITPPQPKIIKQATPPLAGIPSDTTQPNATPGATPVATPATAATDTQTSPDAIEQQLDQVAAANNVTRPDDNAINRRPLKDWLARANALKTQGKLDLSKPVEIIILADFDENGKLTQPPMVVQKSGDPVLIDVAKDMVGAIIDSNALSFLRDPKEQNFVARQLRFTVKLDQSDITARVESEVGSAERAQQLALGYSLMLTLGQQQKKGQDEEAIYKNTKVTSNGKQIVVNFTMPRQMAGEMLKKQLPPQT